MGALIMLGIVWYNWGFWAALAALFLGCFTYQNGYAVAKSE